MRLKKRRMYASETAPQKKVFRTNFFAILIIFCVLIITPLVVFSSNHNGVNGFERQLVFNLSCSTDIADTSRCEVEVGWAEIKEKNLPKGEKERGRTESKGDVTHNFNSSCHIGRLLYFPTSLHHVCSF